MAGRDRRGKGRALVTGANRGLGLGMCELLSERGDDVIAVCRRSSPELDALVVTVVDGIDLGAADVAARLRAAAGTGPIDLVVANAGRNLAFDADRPEDLDLELLEGDLRVTVFGAMATVLAVLPSMRDGSRVLLVSSGASAPGNKSPGNIGYKVAKAALNQFGRVIAQEVRDRGIIVVAVNPGATDTRMLRDTFAAGRTTFDPALARAPRESARAILATAEAATLASSGSFYDSDGRCYTDPDGVPPAA